MRVNIWVGKDWLDQVYKITKQEISDDDVFENAVEYTDIAMVPGQIQVSIEFNTYTNLVERGLLVDWAGAETLTQ
tara:strand:+ start:1927 stop:2151 length:225 start_codon:yes stop_codon:yes gene_type:complete